MVCFIVCSLGCVGHSSVGSRKHDIIILLRYDSSFLKNRELCIFLATIPIVDWFIIIQPSLTFI